jgi:tRNA U38,U39,U40 pseudouridine synthase TruA
VILVGRQECFKVEIQQGLVSRHDFKAFSLKKNNNNNGDGMMRVLLAWSCLDGDMHQKICARIEADSFLLSKHSPRKTT